MADKGDASFKNAYDIQDNKFLRFSILPCNPDTLEDGQNCATASEVDEFFGVVQGQTYIDYDDVQPEDGIHIKDILMGVSYEFINPHPAKQPLV